ncbi:MULTISPECIES: ribonuclease P protein component [unclassified Mycoplasma]|uniref:ribonuclease P protein component n=1 Tax=unclassified Mycoplasma TaxID=2683645 RepID=UPI00211C0E1F|nr:MULTISPECIES: ribonuclease P protein component [unclassified Mycoplasma]UUM19866.1 ribonuclease P protein component [Mycoplasma sp. 1578d]UUM24850.1 ribonuclease P protein component [Mycoplasma sp. 3686d]
MKKENRLKKNWEFNEIMALKQQFLNKYIIVYYQKSDFLKVGLTVPKKFAIAVKRNYYKRQLRAILQNISIQEFKYKFVIIVRKEFLSASFQDKERAIKDLFEKFKNGKIR